jgi:RNA polymerase sigma-B factor
MVTGEADHAPPQYADEDEYAEVTVMFIALEAMSGAQASRQRELIYHRCLRMADNIARHYRGRGEDVEDLTQVARLGLVKAVNRFDPAPPVPPRPR